jgi:hypothetical protein
MLLTPDKLFMVVGPVVYHSLPCDATESVYMKLTLKRFVLCLFKVARHDPCSEFWRLVNSKCPAMRLPGDNVFVPIGSDIFEHLVKLERKRQLKRRTQS